MNNYFSRLFKTILSGKGLLLLISIVIVWFLVSFSRVALSNFYDTAVSSGNYAIVAIMFLPILSFGADLFFEVFYSRTGDLPVSTVLVFSLIAFIISYFGVTLLAIADVGSYLFSILLFISPATVILYKILMVMMELFYQMRIFTLGREPL